MPILDKREDRKGAAPGAREHRGAKRHYQAVIQAEIRRLARALDTDRAQKLLDTDRASRPDPIGRSGGLP